MAETTTDPPSRPEDDGPELSAGVLVAKRYILVRELGAGSAGSVWEAEHSLLTSRVAIKFLDAASSDIDRAEAMLERFRFEAQVSARLAPVTTRIVSVHDAGLHRGVAFLVMELASGQSLEDLLTTERIQPQEVAGMLLQIGEALDAAHAAGIAHRDVKPANILCQRRGVAEAGSYKLADFGVAKLFGENLVGILPPKQTAENTLLGSPAYMSPEYVSGVPVIDGRADVWALGVVAYEALTQAIPFGGDVWTQIALAIVQGNYVPASERTPGLGPEVDRFFERAFARDPAARFTRASALAEAFAAAVGLDAEGLQASTGGIVRSLPARRSSTGAVFGFVGALLLVVLGGWLMVRRPAADDPASNARPSPVLGESAQIPAAENTAPERADDPSVGSSAATPSASASGPPAPSSAPVRKWKPLQKSEVF